VQTTSISNLYLDSNATQGPLFKTYNTFTMLGAGSSMQRGAYQTARSGSGNQRKNSASPPPAYTRTPGRSLSYEVSKHPGAYGGSYKLNSHADKYQVSFRTALNISHPQTLPGPRRPSNVSQARNDPAYPRNNSYPPRKDSLHLRNAPKRPVRPDLRSTARTHEVLKESGWKDSQSRESAEYEPYTTIRRMDGRDTRKVYNNPHTIKHEVHESSRAGWVPHVSQDQRGQRHDSGVSFDSISSTSQEVPIKMSLADLYESSTSQEVPIKMSMADRYNKPLPSLPKREGVYHPRSHPRPYDDPTKTANKDVGSRNTERSAFGAVQPAYQRGSSTQVYKPQLISQAAPSGYYERKPTVLASEKAKVNPVYHHQAGKESPQPTKAQQKLKASVSRPDPLRTPEERYPTNIAVERGGIGGPAVTSWPNSPSRSISLKSSKLQKKQKPEKKAEEPRKPSFRLSWGKRLTKQAGKLIALMRNRVDSDKSFGCKGLSEDYLAQVARAKKRSKTENAQQFAYASGRIQEVMVEGKPKKKKNVLVKKSRAAQARAPEPLFSGPKGQYPRKGRWV
jgi:hypothetical protein